MNMPWPHLWSGRAGCMSSRISTYVVQLMLFNHKHVWSFIQLCNRKYHSWNIKPQCNPPLPLQVTSFGSSSGPQPASCLAARNLHFSSTNLGLDYFLKLIILSVHFLSFESSDRGLLSGQTLSKFKVCFLKGPVNCVHQDLSMWAEVLKVPGLVPRMTQAHSDCLQGTLTATKDNSLFLQSLKEGLGAIRGLELTLMKIHVQMHYGFTELTPPCFFSYWFYRTQSPGTSPSCVEQSWC